MNIQSWILVGILLGTVLLLVLTIRSGRESKSNTVGSETPSENASQTVHRDSPDSLDLALELAEYFLQQGEKDIASRYISEVREAGSEKQKEQAKQLMERLSGHPPII
ncbi:MAG: hypothetical protein OXE41_05515 [Gammaproteobacteria bacterium]|nr:hypothetical protein [Gammaproteobacteria bacterium]MCY4219014.1 hypothetical protein [Gammaproteobacteria bacterium]MCY4274835.1 hypothetical protein [Gammaproteobacteria bacterium]